MQADYTHHTKSLEELQTYVGDITLHEGWNYNNGDSMCISQDNDIWTMCVWNDQSVEEVQKRLKKFYSL